MFFHVNPSIAQPQDFCISHTLALVFNIPTADHAFEAIGLPNVTTGTAYCSRSGNPDVLSAAVRIRPVHVAVSGW